MSGFNADCAVLDPKVAGSNITVLTASANTDALDIGHYGEAIVFLVVTANSGTTPTLDCKIQYSPDTINWVDSGDSFTQLTTVNGIFFKKLTANFGKYIRLVFTTGGTTPSYTFKPKVVIKQT